MFCFSLWVTPVWNRQNLFSYVLLSVLPSILHPFTLAEKWGRAELACFNFSFSLEFCCNSTKCNSLSQESSKYIAECFCLHVLADLLISACDVCLPKASVPSCFSDWKCQVLFSFFLLEINTGLPLVASRCGIAPELPGAMAETTPVTPGGSATSLSHFQMYQCYLLGWERPALLALEVGKSGRTPSLVITSYNAGRCRALCHAWDPSHVLHKE